MKKHAQIFTVLGIVMLVLLFVSFEVYSLINQRNSVQTRVTTMKTFLNSIESNLERQMFISGFRILFLAESEITTTGNYIDVDDFFNESFFNGTVNGVSEETILPGATYVDILDSINEKASKINVNVSMSNPTITIVQEDPWNIIFTLSTSFVMSDKENLARWEKVQNISAIIPIEGFEDPVFYVETVGKVPRQIQQTPYEGNYVSGADYSNLSNHFNQKYYANNSNAPSFLMRLEGNLSADENGIESFVKVGDLQTQGINPDLTKTVVDYLYFDSASHPGTAYLQVSPFFIIDDGHKSKYQL